MSEEDSSEELRKLQNKPKKGPGPFIRLSGIGLQMGVTIIAGAYLGKYLDAEYGSSEDSNGWTIGLTLFAVAASLYNVIRQVNKLNKDND
ncbi:MAG: AtpZ/AtpI family protein [Flavobacteriales bacterium]|jgi:F0F1-type ATP synthase assembly protein I|nr:AtpZ/AtpI family protein [Flavobacteriales bacterium]